MLGLKFEIEENGSLEEELKAFTKKVESRIPHALETVGTEMRMELQKTIVEEVYLQYTPHAKKDTDMYGRRWLEFYHDSLQGQAAAVHPLVENNTLTFTYEPHGYQRQTSDPLHGNDLIRRIETGQGYSWDHNPGARPFWTLFVQKMGEKDILNYFQLGMMPQFEVCAEGGEKDVEFDGSEYVPGTTIVLPV